MSPQGGGEPAGELAAAIERDLGGLEVFKQAFTQAALSRFGSGWAWLVVDRSGKLQVVSSANQDSPCRMGWCPFWGWMWGTRLLPEVPEQASRLHSRVLQGDRLGRGGAALRGGAGLIAGNTEPNERDPPVGGSLLLRGRRAAGCCRCAGGSRIIHGRCLARHGCAGGLGTAGWCCRTGGSRVIHGR